MNLRNLDLNLLVILDALLEERHVSRAAKRLGLSQPAASNALERLRHRFGDPLLERRGRQMQLTPRSEALREPLRQALHDLGAVIEGPAPPDVAGLRQTVRLALADLVATMVVPSLYRALAATAPGLDLAVLPWSHEQSVAERLERDELDLAVTTPAHSAVPLRRERLLHIDYLVTMRRDHPAAADFGLEAWLAHPHLLVSTSGARQGMLDPVLAAHGLERHVKMTVSGFLMVPRILAETDLITLMPASYFRQAGQHRELATFPPPIPLPGTEIHLAWHPRRDRDVAVQAVRSLFSRKMQSFEKMTGFLEDPRSMRKAVERRPPAWKSWSGSPRQPCFRLPSPPDGGGLSGAEP